MKWWGWIGIVLSVGSFLTQLLMDERRMARQDYFGLCSAFYATTTFYTTLLGLLVLGSAWI